MKENNSPVTLSDNEGSQGFFATLRMTRSEGLRITHSKKKLFEGV